MRREVFAEGKSWKKLWIIFFLFSIFGCYFEMIHNLVKTYLENHTIFWEIRSGVIYGPFSVIYGFGAVLMTIFLVDKKYKDIQIFLYGSIICGIAEYIISLLQETFIGTVSWDYHNQLLDINGRTTIPIMLFWGLLCYTFVKYIYPFLSRQLEKVPIKIGNILLYISLILLSIDMFISFSALIRQYLRHNQVKAFTFYGEFLDQYYPDKRLKKAYPNMKFIIGE